MLRRVTFFIQAFYKDGVNEVAVDLSEINLQLSNIRLTDANVAKVTSAELSFSDDKKTATLTVEGLDNGETNLIINTAKTSVVTAKNDDDVAETANSYTEATATVTIEVTGGGSVMPPSISPEISYYGQTFKANVKGYDGLTTYYLLMNRSASSGEISTLSTDNQEVEATDIPDATDLVAAVKEAMEDNPSCDPDQEYVGGIFSDANIAAVNVKGATNAHYILCAVSVKENGTDEPTYSRVVYTDYLYNKLDEPALTPGYEGADTYYGFDGTLNVEANVEAQGCAIYYTVNEDLSFTEVNGEVKTNGILYSEPITIDKSSVIQAIAFSEDLDVYSDIVTYRYAKKTTEFSEPVFAIGEVEYTDGTKYYQSISGVPISIKSVYVDGNGERHTIGGEADNVNWDNDIYHIYYTTDGSYPNDKSKHYERPVTVDDATFFGRLRAVVYADGNGGDHSVSEVSTLVVYRSEKAYWEADENHCPNGVLAGKKATLEHDGETWVNIEFGGIDTDNKELVWKHYESKEEQKGSPLDYIGDYTISPADNTYEGVGNVKDELGNLYNHSKANDLSTGFQTHTATFGLPAKGAYVKFEPQVDGELNIWCCQEGALYYNNSNSTKDCFNNGFIRKRPMYFVDEAGKSYLPTDIKSAGTLSDNWSKDRNEGYWTKKGDSENGIVQDLYTQAQARGIYDMFNGIITTKRADSDTSISDLLVYLNTEANKVVAGYNVAEDAREEGDNADYTPDNVVDGTGICLPSASYMKYSFDVKAGKTYYFFGWMTKIGIRGFGFQKSEENVEATVPEIYSGNSATGDGGDSKVNDFTSMVGKQYAQVKLHRTFKPNVWTTLVLPFSVSASQVKDVFGEGTQVLHYRTIEGTTMYFFKHYHQMIVAGTPVLIKPTKEDLGDEVTFTNVTIESSEVTDKPCNDYGYEGKTNTNYQMIGSYKPQHVDDYNYYIGSDGRVYRLVNNGNGSTLYGTRSYIVGMESNGTVTSLTGRAKAAYDNLSPTSMDDEVTDIDIIPTGNESKENTVKCIYNSNIYSVDGVLVRQGTTKLEGLRKGVYVVNGKKLIVE